MTTRAVQIDPVTRSIRRTDRIRPESGRPDCSGESKAGLHHQKPIPADWFRFYFSDISLRSGEILTESGNISSNPVRFSLDLAKSHWILGKYCWNLENYRQNLGFLPDLCSFHRFLAVFSDLWLRPTRHHPLMVWTVQSDYSGGSAAGAFFSHSILASRFRVGHKPDPDRPMDSPNYYYHCNISNSSLPLIHFPKILLYCFTNFLDRPKNLIYIVVITFLFYPSFFFFNN